MKVEESKASAGFNKNITGINELYQFKYPTVCAADVGHLLQCFQRKSQMLFCQDIFVCKKTSSRVEVYRKTTLFL